MYLFLVSIRRKTGLGETVLVIGSDNLSQHLRLRTIALINRSNICLKSLNHRISEANAYQMLGSV